MTKGRRRGGHSRLHEHKPDIDKRPRCLGAPMKRDAPRTSDQRDVAARLQPLPRRHAELGSLDLFAHLDEGAAQGHLADPARVDAVAAHFRDGVVASLQNSARLFGWHTQVMFGQVVRGLGKAVLVSEQDQGTTWARPTDVVRPGDYRVVLPDGRNLSIEVKNHASKGLDKPFRLRRADLQGLVRHAELTRSEPRVAIYWTGPGLWLLVDPARFTTRDSKAEITMTTAMGENEMAVLGDEMIGTVPPLELVIDVVETGLTKQADDNGRREATIQIRRITIEAGDQALRTRAARRLAFYLIWNGKWRETEHDDFEAGRLQRIRFRYEPEDWPREQGFAFLGWRSELIARSFWLRTSDEGLITKLRAEIDPTGEGLVLPADVGSSELRLWRMRLHPWGAGQRAKSEISLRRKA